MKPSSRGSSWPEALDGLLGEVVYANEPTKVADETRRRVTEASKRGYGVLVGNTQNDAARETD